MTNKKYDCIDTKKGIILLGTNGYISTQEKWRYTKTDNNEISKIIKKFNDTAI